MGTIVEHVHVQAGGWRDRHSALHLAVSAARRCLHRAAKNPREIDLLINAGIYRDRNLGEPALAALIQDDISANPEDPHAEAHGTFSFDIANGSCGPLTALAVVDGFLRSGTVHSALITASDADPGHRLSEGFPFAPVGAAMLCGWTDDDSGLGPVSWAGEPDGGDSFRATVGVVGHRNLLQFHESDELDRKFAVTAGRAATDCLARSGLDLSDIDAVVAAPARHGYRSALAGILGTPVERIFVAPDEAVHTAALAAALSDAVSQTGREAALLLVAAGAGVTAGAAVYRNP